MKTPREWSTLLSYGIVTGEMLASCLDAVNFYADQCQEKIKQFPAGPPASYYIGRKNKYKAMRKIYLSRVQPICTHKIESGGITRYRLYYKIAGMDFHIPVRRADLPDIPIVPATWLYISATERQNYVSPQFCEKVANALKSRDTIYLPEWKGQ